MRMRAAHSGGDPPIKTITDIAKAAGPTVLGTEVRAVAYCMGLSLVPVGLALVVESEGDVARLIDKVKAYKAIKLPRGRRKALAASA